MRENKPYALNKPSWMTNSLPSHSYQPSYNQYEPYQSAAFDQYKPLPSFNILTYPKSYEDTLGKYDLEYRKAPPEPKYIKPKQYYKEYSDDDTKMVSFPDQYYWIDSKGNKRVRVQKYY